MKVLFLNPPFTDYGGLEGHGGKALPLNLAYLAAYLREKRPDIKLAVLDCEALRLTYPKIKQQVEKIMPDIVAMTAPTPAFLQVLEVCRLIKEISSDLPACLPAQAGIITVVGGPHPTALPKETAEEKNIDICIVGEGEITFVELAEAIEKKIPLSEVKGIAYKDGKGRVLLSEPRELIKDLDQLPFPARDLFDTDLYFPPPTKRVSNKKAGNMITSRGCCYACTFCMASFMWGRRVRFRSIKNVVDEIEECLEKFGIGEFNFHDELFTIDRQRTIDFCREVRRRKLDIAWVCMCRVDFIDQEILREMKEAGCKKIMFGFESGSQLVLDKMKKRVDLERAPEAVRLVRRAGIKSAGNFMFGNISETEETIKESIALAKKLNCDTMAFFVASPYPGTEFYEIAKRRGYLRPDLEWRDFTLVSNNRPPLNLPGLEAEQILKWQKKAYFQYYLRPRYILRKVASLRNRIDLENLINGLKLFLRLEK